MTGNCPSCGAYSYVGDNYGMTCTRCGYNFGFGEWARQGHCNHVWEYRGNEAMCVYCEELREEAEE